MFLNQSPMLYSFHVSALWLSAAMRWLLEDPQTSATMSLLTSLARSNGFAVAVAARTPSPRAKAFNLTMTIGLKATRVNGKAYSRISLVLKEGMTSGWHAGRLNHLINPSRAAEPSAMTRWLAAWSTLWRWPAAPSSRPNPTEEVKHILCGQKLWSPSIMLPTHLWSKDPIPN